jgi:uncharacterized protein (DUF1778 family)
VAPKEHPVTETADKRSERINLRMTPTAKRTLERAAAATNKTLSEFLLHAGINTASDTLADRRVFRLDEQHWSAFLAALAAPPKNNPGLRKLLARKAAWEQ